MIVDGANLDRAVRRYWFRHPDVDGVVLVKLPAEAQRAIAEEAIELERGEL